jgi:hypothetical protein
MRNFDEAHAAAMEKPAFSNGTESEAWEENWCGRCIHDAKFRQAGVGDGCPLMLVAVLGRTPAEWIDQRPNGHRLGDTYHCTEFRDVEDGPGDEPEPEPIPVIDGQMDMFEVFADQVIEQAQQAADRVAVVS